MSKNKYPIRYKSLLDFNTGGTETVEELPEDRAKRLRRERSLRRTEVIRLFRKSAPEELTRALSKAFRLAYDGKQLPIHFDVLFQKGTVSLTERYTLWDASFSQHLFKPDEIVGNMGAIKMETNRTAEVAPHFVHLVTFSVGI